MSVLPYLVMSVLPYPFMFLSTLPLHVCVTLPLHVCVTLLLHVCVTLPLHVCVTLPLHVFVAWHESKLNTCTLVQHVPSTSSLAQCSKLNETCMSHCGTAAIFDQLEAL